MRFHLRKPLHGWREFFHEIIIVVIGVLLALGGARLIDTLHSRSEVASFREAVAMSSAAISASTKHDAMAGLRHSPSSLTRALPCRRSRRPSRPARPIGLYFSAWDNKGGAVTDQLPFKTRIAYGEVYDEFRNERALLNERDAWRSLSQFEQPLPLMSQANCVCENC